jgi:putative transposase
VIFNQRHLRRVLSTYIDYYHRTRTHLSLEKDCPDPRPIMPDRSRRFVAIPQVSRLHHRYERLAADQYHFLFANIARRLFHVV